MAATIEICFLVVYSNKNHLHSIETAAKYLQRDCDGPVIQRSEIVSLLGNIANAVGETLI
jgi:hypothetical protein